MNFLWKTYREGRNGGIDVHGHFEQPSGVLKGQILKRWLDNYESVEAALAAHPEARSGSEWTDAPVSLSHLPGEEDNVPGGALPDDIDVWPPEP